MLALRVDRPDVFAHVHDPTFSLIEEGLVQGLCIDHIDGLLDPTEYLETLRQTTPRPIYLAVEKILAPHESLPARWPVEGTTGNEGGALLTRLLVQGSAEAAVTACYARCGGDRDIVILVDLSRAHRAGLSPIEGYRTVVGDRTSPVRVGLN